VPVVVCLTLSAGCRDLPSCARGAEEVRGRVDVRVVDTRTVSVGEAMVVLETARVGATTNDLDLAEAAARAVVRTSKCSARWTLWTTYEKGAGPGRPGLLGVTSFDQAGPGNP